MRALIFASVLLAGFAVAEPGFWFEPARDGHGLYVTQDTGAGNALTWYLYRTDGSSAVLVSGEHCDGFPCVTTLHEPTADFMGGNPDLGEPVGEIELWATDTGLRARYDLRNWRPDECFDISPGGVIFRQCAGSIDFVLLAR